MVKLSREDLFDSDTPLFSSDSDEDPTYIPDFDDLAESSNIDLQNNKDTYNIVLSPLKEKKSNNPERKGINIISNIILNPSTNNEQVDTCTSY